MFKTILDHVDLSAHPHRAHLIGTAMTGPGLDAANARSRQPDLRHFLGRHGITPRILVRDPQPDAGHALRHLAAEPACGMLVPGCYWPGKIRELCLGGASRTVLAH